MIKTLIKLAFRNIKKDLSYSLITILGLTIGITSSLFLLLFIFDDLSYDRYHEKGDNIYRVVSNLSEPDDAFTWAVTQIPFAPQVKEDYPEVEDFVRFINEGRTLYKNNEIEFYDEDVYYSDPTVFNVFSYKLIDGDAETVLTEPNTMVVTESFSEKYFGAENPVGKTIETGDGRIFNITGLMKDVPHNSHFTFSALFSRSSLPAEMGSWGSFGVPTYLLLQEGYDPDLLDEKLPEIYEKFMAEMFARMGVNVDYELQPIKDIHLFSNIQEETGQSGDITYIYIFSAVAIFMLVIACINYMNMATARSSRRAKEVGIRKVIGSQRRQLIGQFLIESIVFALISLILSLILCYILIPPFNNLSGKFVEPDFLYSPPVLLSLAAIILITGFIGGSYPAFFLSGFQPVEVLKGRLAKGSSNVILRKILVIVQFSISMIMLISTIVVYDQINYMKKKDVGFEKDNLVIVDYTTREMIEKYPVLRDALLTNPGVISVCSSSDRMGQGSRKVLLNVETSEGMQERGINLMIVDHDFIKTMGVNILEGRGFSEEFRSDTAGGVVINELMAQRFNWENPLGKKIQINREGVPPAEVVGVMQNFHQRGLYNEMEPLMLMYRDRNFLVNIKVDGENISSTLDLIEETWKGIYPDQPFEYNFLEDDFNGQFEADEKRGIIFTYFSILTVIIACLGLFGLASFTVEQRTKEVAIRKVLGANANRIVQLISREFLILIGFAVVVSFPLAWFFMNKWLQDYPYRTDLNIFIFILAALITVVITFLTISFHTMKASVASPIDALAQE